eukprot:GFYU01014014.1.p1 GENE.GFYU01014014.1~~GFYU01014014.1.p1  ORF type:complete len:928 (+),score=284.84 GFYU01014014.1:180-2963(+)
MSSSSIRRSKGAHGDGVELMTEKERNEEKLRQRRMTSHVDIEHPRARIMRKFQGLNAGGARLAELYDLAKKPLNTITDDEMEKITKPNHFEFAIVMNWGEGLGKSIGDIYDEQTQVLTNVIETGLDVTVLEETVDSDDNFICLISCQDDHIMLRAKDHLDIQRKYTTDGHTLGGQGGSSSVLSMSPAERIQTIAFILQSPVDGELKGAGLDLENPNSFVVDAVFPLHDDDFNQFTMGLYKKSVDSDQFVTLIRRHFGEELAFYFAWSVHYKDALKGIAIVGVLLYLIMRFAHLQGYMIALSIFGCFVAFIWAPATLATWTRKTYELVNHWNLQNFKEADYPNPNFTNATVEHICTKCEKSREPRKDRPTCTCEPVALESFDGQDGDAETTASRLPATVEYKYVSTGRKVWTYCWTAPFVITLIALVTVAIFVFTQWYFLAELAPVCDWEVCKTKVWPSNMYYGQTDARFHGAECDSAMLTCFETTENNTTFSSIRFLYVIGQGVALSFLISVVFWAMFKEFAVWLTTAQEHPTMQDHQNSIVFKYFVSLWCGFFGFFLVMSFIYMPFGKDVQDWIKDNIDTSISYHIGRDWYSTFDFHLVQAIATPLVVLEVINLFYKIIFPWVRRKFRHSQNTRRHDKRAAAVEARRQEIMASTSGEKLTPLQKRQTERDINPQNSAALARRISQRLIDDRIIFEPLPLVTEFCQHLGHHQSSDSGKCCVCLGVVCGHEHSITPQQTTEVFHTASGVCEEAKLSPYSPFYQYMDSVIQFGYVVMFSIVWPFFPFLALVVDALEIRSDAVSLCIDKRRVVSRKANSIGIWERMYSFEVWIGVVVVAGLFVASTGQLDYWTHCKTNDHSTYGPLWENAECTSVLLRSLVFIALVFVGQVSVYAWTVGFGDRPAHVKKAETIRVLLDKHNMHNSEANTV